MTRADNDPAPGDLPDWMGEAKPRPSPMNGRAVGPAPVPDADDWMARVREEADAILRNPPDDGSEAPDDAEDEDEVSSDDEAEPVAPVPGFGGRQFRDAGLLRTPDPYGDGDDGSATLAFLRGSMGTKVPDEDSPGNWRDALPGPPPDVLPTAGRDDAPQAPTTAPDAPEEDEVGPNTTVAPGSQAEADMLEEVLQRKGLVPGPAKTIEPKWTYWVLDGTEPVEEMRMRPKRLLRMERDPLVRALMSMETVFLPGETPLSLSHLYRKCVLRQFKPAMRQVRVRGVVGTVVRNSGFIHAFGQKRPVADVFEQHPSGRAVRMEQAAKPDGRRVEDRERIAEAKAARKASRNGT